MSLLFAEWNVISDKPITLQFPNLIFCAISFGNDIAMKVNAATTRIDIYFITSSIIVYVK